MTLDMNNTDKLNEFRLEARRLGIEVVSPDVNRSGVAFEAVDGRIVYALAALKGVGTHAVEHLVAVRGDTPFADLADFAHRVDPQIVNRKALECLVQAGAFDSLDPDRAKLFENIGRILAAAQERSERSASGIVDLFGGSGEPTRLFLDDGRSLAAGGAAAARIRRRRHVSQRPSDRRLRRRSSQIARRAHLEGVSRPAPR